MFWRRFSKHRRFWFSLCGGSRSGDAVGPLLLAAPGNIASVKENIRLKNIKLKQQRCSIGFSKAIRFPLDLLTPVLSTKIGAQSRKPAIIQYLNLLSSLDSLSISHPSSSRSESVRVLLKRSVECFLSGVCSIA